MSGPLASWYTQGGFTDEYGNWHESDHYYKIDYWEVLNEPEGEHSMTPQYYAKVYDAIVKAVRAIIPDVKFVGLATDTPRRLELFTYFLDASNHDSAALPIDAISYHHYEHFDDQNVPLDQVFSDEDQFVSLVQSIDSIRQSLSPETKTFIDEFGIYSPTTHYPIPDSFWNIAAASYAYTYQKLSQIGTEGLQEASLLGHPGMFPTLTMMDWNSGQPNARYWGLKLLIDNCEPGDKEVKTTSDVPCVAAQGYITPKGAYKILLINKCDQSVEFAVTGLTGAEEEYVDQSTGSNPPSSHFLVSDRVTLGGLAVAVVTFP